MLTSWPCGESLHTVLIVEYVVQVLSGHVWAAVMTLLVKVLRMATGLLFLRLALLTNVLPLTGVFNDDVLAVGSLLDEAVVKELLNFCLDLVRMIEVRHHIVPLVLHLLHLSHALPVFRLLVLLAHLLLEDLSLAAAALCACLHEVARDSFRD